MDAFTDVAEALRPELLRHCYRLCGSLEEAEDLVQETMLRGWRSADQLRDHAAVRGWLYRIATNAYLSRRRYQRALPSQLGAPAADPRGEVVIDAGVRWIEPFPDALIADGPDPETMAIAREQLRLALIAALQRLPARQRAALLLREALDASAAEIADVLGTAVPAAKSLLQRARATLDQPDHDGRDLPAAERRVLDRYMRAFETADVTLLEQTLREDASLEMIPARTWFSGRVTCLPYLTTVLGSPGDWTMTATAANGQPAALARRNGELFGVAVLTIRAGGLARITLFTEPSTIQRFTRSARADPR